MLGVLVRVMRAQRVLEIGTGSGTTGVAMADALPADGMLITLERQADVAATARQAFETAGHARKVSVIVGDASRYLHKVGGPFDLVIQDGDPELFGALHERLVMLLAPHGALITNNVAHGGYNEMLSADSRLHTTVLTVGDGVAVSVRRGNQT